MDSEQIRTYVFYILITFIILISILIFINLNNIIFDSSQNKKIVKVGVMEAMDKMATGNEEEEDLKVHLNDDNNSIIKVDPAGDFCSTHTGSSHTLIESCGKLTNQNCNSTSCCVMLNGKKCVPGNKDGPTFKTLKGEPIEIDYYYYQNKKHHAPKKLPRPKPP